MNAVKTIRRQSALERQKKLVAYYRSMPQDTIITTRRGEVLVSTKLGRAQVALEALQAKPGVAA